MTDRCALALRVAHHGGGGGATRLRWALAFAIAVAVASANMLAAVGRRIASPLDHCRICLVPAFVCAVVVVGSQRGRGAREHKDDSGHKDTRLDRYSLPQRWTHR
jgi:hypothetical protein